MPARKRYRTSYPGVFYIEGKAVGSNKPERIYYIMYRRDGKLVEEKIGRQYQDNMTSARAANLRIDRINGNSLSNAEKREAERAAKLEEKNRWTITRLWEHYKENVVLKGLVEDESRFRNHIEARLGDKEPEQLSPFDLDSLRVKLLQKHKPQTVRNVLELIQRVINYGSKKRLCEPLHFKIDMPKVDNIRTEDLTAEQLQRLLAVLDDETKTNIQAANFMRMALFTGMRRGELFRLKWSDIDFQRGFIAIVHPKGGKSQSIPLNDSARSVLESHPRTGSEYVFPGKDGNQRTDFKKPIQRIRDRAGLPKDFRPLHGLRHTFASTLASSGQVDMYTLQKLLTHKSPLMTQRYAHLRDESLRKASNLVGELVKESVKQAKKQRENRA